jgi:uncharacterized protein
MTSQKLYAISGVIETVRDEVERACKANTNAFGYGIWTHHIIHVVKHGQDLATVLNAETDIVELAALLHDYAGIKNVVLEPEHHLHGVNEAGWILSTLGVPQEKISAVQHCILTHRASQSLKPETLEATCLASADAMAHISQARSLLHLAYTRKGLDIDSGAVWVREKLARSYRKLCPEAKQLIEVDYRAAQRFLNVKTISYD